MISSGSPSRSRFRLISMVPAWSIVLLAASTPTFEASDSTAGSCRMALAAACCISAMRA
jgi:hypothetical protein